MPFRLFRKTIEINKTEQIKERTKLLKKIVEGCATHPGYKGDGPATGICKNCLDVREAHLALREFDKNNS